ncbi:SEC-C domain-containing protein [Priestia aryabhattai]
MIVVGQSADSKFQPYKPCPCDSGKNFKFCCYPKAIEAKNSKSQKERYEEYSDGRINYEIHKLWEETDFKTCFGFDKEKCKKEIKSAHSIQNNRILNRISVDNHVYRFSNKATKRDIGVELKKVSKNKASTFFGFCDFHDTELFKPIELREYNEEPLQNFLFAFRALCLESHKKARELEVRKNIFRKRPELMIDRASVFQYQVSCLDIEDYAESRELFKQDYFNNDFSKIRTFYRKLDFEIEFATSSAFAIQHDIYGNEIQDIYSLKEDISTIYVNVYPVDGGTNILLSYRTDQDFKFEGYFKQLETLTDQKLMQHLNRLIIQYTENIFFSPNFIENLTERERESLTDTIQSSINLTKRLDLILDDNYFNFNLFNKST